MGNYEDRHAAKVEAIEALEHAALERAVRELDSRRVRRMHKVGDLLAPTEPAISPEALELARTTPRTTPWTPGAAQAVLDAHRKHGAGMTVDAWVNAVAKYGLMAVVGVAKR